jgi:excisionase family DNA binding protein
MVEIAGTKYYKTDEIAKMLEVHVDTVRRWIREGKLKTKKIGRAYLIPEKELLKLIEENGNNQKGEGE